MSTDQQKYFKSKATGVGLLLAGILLIASNLRAPLTSVGSLIPAIRDSLGVSNTVIGTITTLPLIAFALISPISPKLANRFGMERTILFSMVILAVGIGLRSVTGVSTLFIGTAL
ncbi:MAG TPA: MFS transporter, partial [Pseudogracilibacillus sp.]|nr:MFS transporter [Pseudogracilibacillus sp.]